MLLQAEEGRPGCLIIRRINWRNAKATTKYQWEEKKVYTSSNDNAKPVENGWIWKGRDNKEQVGGKKEIKQVIWLAGWLCTKTN